MADMLLTVQCLPAVRHPAVPQGAPKRLGLCGSLTALCRAGQIGEMTLNAEHLQHTIRILTSDNGST